MVLHRRMWRRWKERDGAPTMALHRAVVAAAFGLLDRARGDLLAVRKADGVDTDVALAAPAHAPFGLGFGDGGECDRTPLDDHVILDFDIVQNFEVDGFADLRILATESAAQPHPHGSPVMQNKRSRLRAEAQGCSKNEGKKRVWTD